MGQSKSPRRKRINGQESADAVAQFGVILSHGVVPEQQEASKQARWHNSTSKQQLRKPFRADCADLRTLYAHNETPSRKHVSTCTNQPPFYGHYTGQPALAGASS